MIMDAKILCRNCRGAGNKDFLREIRDLMRNYNPTIVVQIEPLISGSRATEVCDKLGKSYWIRSEVDGFSGGVWLLWDGDSVKIELLNVHESFIHVEVNPQSSESWIFTAIYASPNAYIRKELWPVLDELQIIALGC